jgi:phosphate:Na+ symporter
MGAFDFIFQILTLAGALGLFLYGMRTMSEALQKIAGKNMRNVLAKITANPFRGLLAGFLVTGVIQSSSATTVMLVSFVNAGLLTFTESLGVIFGANIGTTVTAWIISLLGFSSTFSFFKVLLPLIALSLPFFFSYRSANKARAEFIIGFALLFIGIYFFKTNVPEISETSVLFQYVQQYQGGSYWNILLFVAIGVLITIIFQSSSATIALTMVLATEGWLNLDFALAMVLGENVGTTSTAVVAAIVANKSAKRTALAHFLFNMIGILWVLVLFRFFSNLIQNFIDSIHLSTGGELTNIIPVGISIFHTAFNIINTMLFLALIKPFAILCYKLLPMGKGLSEAYSLRFIDNTLLSTSELSLIQVRHEIANMGHETQRLFRMIPDLLNEKNEFKFNKKFRKLGKLEDIIDTMEVEISGYITKLSQDELSEDGNQKVRAMQKIIDNLESIADMCYQMGLTIEKKNENKAWFTQELRNNLGREFVLISKSLALMVSNLEKDYNEVEIEDALAIENEINKMRNDLKKLYLDELKSEKLPYQTGAFYNDLLGISEKIGDFALNVNQAMYKTRKVTKSKEH